MKTIVIALACIFSALSLQAQSTHDIMVGGGLDLIKTDIRQVFGKAQTGVEANYFIVRHFSVGVGAEIWTGNRNSFVMGVRYYADDNFFARFRGLIGENDASIGVGWSKPFMTDWRMEALGDFYFRGEFGLRAGVAYIIK